MHTEIIIFAEFDVPSPDAILNINCCDRFDCASFAVIRELLLKFTIIVIPVFLIIRVHNTFKYFHFNLEKKREFSRNGDRYEVSPWSLLYHKPMCSGRWFRSTETLLTKHILPYFGKMKLSDISTGTVQRFYNEKAKSGYATSTIKHIKCLLSQILDSAMEDDLIDKNPVKSKRLTIIHKEIKRMPLTAAQVSDILQHIRDLDEQQQFLIVLPLFTGMRRGEMLALTWGDVDLTANVIHITKAVEFFNGNIPTIKAPKTDAGIRDLPITDDLWPYLTRSQHAAAQYVIGNELQPVTKRAFEWCFRHIPIDLHGATAHVFRHTFATLAASRTDPKTLQGLLGHAKCDITMNRYAHVRQESLAQAGQKLSGMYDV